MEAHNDGHSVDEVSALFEKDYGFPLSRPQIIGWRQLNRSYENAAKEYRARRSRFPIGTIKVSEKYGIAIKTAACSDVSGRKDNWEPLNHAIYSLVHGPIPEGHDVFAADGNKLNVHPDNLVAVPKNLRARVNDIGYHDSDSLREAIAIAQLQAATVDKLARMERKCAVCGKTFAPGRDKVHKNGKGAARQKTCEDCIAAGRKPPCEPKHECRCRVCGMDFLGKRRSTMTCDRCIEKYRELGGTSKTRVSYSTVRRYLRNHGADICKEWW